MIKRMLFILMTMVLLPAAVSRADEPAVDAKDLVRKSATVLDRFMEDRNFDWLREHLKEAKGVMIFPRVIKAGFFWGGSGGNGVLSVRDEKTGAWSQPAFYSIGSVSFGFQAGVEEAEVVMLAMNRRAVDSLYASSLKFGGAVSIAAGPHGAGAKRVFTTDFLAFSRAKGLYAGINMEGSGVQVREDLNRAYYGREARPVQIITEHLVGNPASEKLLEALRKAAH